MLRLIGGPPHVGKSLLADAALRELAPPVRTASFEPIYKIPDIQPKPGTFDRENILEKATAYHDLFRIFIANIVKSEAHTVIDCDLIVPSMVAEIRELTDVRVVFLGLGQTTLEQILRTEGHFKWVREKTAEQQAELPNLIIANSRLLKAECEGYNEPYVDLYPDYEAGQRRALDYLLAG